jgi:hypothetical protein
MCGKPVYRRPLQIKGAKGRVFCGQVCYGISCRKEKACAVCGTLILASANKKTCGRECANRHRVSIKYKIGRPRDKAEHYRSLKLRLLGERGEKCGRCDYGRMEILEIHHRDRNRENNSLENLELICPNCHAEEHYLKGSWLRNI